MKQAADPGRRSAHRHLRVCAPGFESARRAFKDGWLEANQIKLLEDDSLPRRRRLQLMLVRYRWCELSPRKLIMPKGKQEEAPRRSAREDAEVQPREHESPIELRVEGLRGRAATSRVLSMMMKKDPEVKQKRDELNFLLADYKDGDQGRRRADRLHQVPARLSAASCRSFGGAYLHEVLKKATSAEPLPFSWRVPRCLHPRRLGLVRGPERSRVEGLIENDQPVQLWSYPAVTSMQPASRTGSSWWPSTSPRWW
jgi:hypothetical protein